MYFVWSRNDQSIRLQTISFLRDIDEYDKIKVIKVVEVTYRRRWPMNVVGKNW